MNGYYSVIVTLLRTQLVLLSINSMHTCTHWFLNICSQKEAASTVWSRSGRQSLLCLWLSTKPRQQKPGSAGAGASDLACGKPELSQGVMDITFRLSQRTQCGGCWRQTRPLTCLKNKVWQVVICLLILPETHVFSKHILIGQTQCSGWMRACY